MENTKNYTLYVREVDTIWTYITINVEINWFSMHRFNPAPYNHSLLLTNIHQSHHIYLHQTLVRLCLQIGRQTFLLLSHFSNSSSIRSRRRIVPINSIVSNLRPFGSIGHAIAHSHLHFGIDSFTQFNLTFRELTASVLAS